MPLGSLRSIIPYSPTNFTAVDGTTYKSQLDSVSAIGANPGGAFFVFPTSPATLSVFIDSGYNYSQLGGAIILNPTGAPASVVISPPASSFRYATVCWDFTNNNPIVNYAAIGATPIMGDAGDLVPLAVVGPVTPTTTVISAPIIRDVRMFCSPGLPLHRNIGNATVNQTINCSGASSVSISVGVATAVSISLTLSFLSIGVPIFIRYFNASASSVTFSVIAFTPAGIPYTGVGKLSSGTNTFNLTTGFTAVTNSAFILVGSSHDNPTLFLAVQ